MTAAVAAPVASSLMRAMLRAFHNFVNTEKLRLS
jgi:hypothetical protein